MPGGDADLIGVFLAEKLLERLRLKLPCWLAEHVISWYILLYVYIVSQPPSLTGQEAMEGRFGIGHEDKRYVESINKHLLVTVLTRISLLESFLVVHSLPQNILQEQNPNLLSQGHQRVSKLRRRYITKQYSPSKSFAWLPVSVPKAHYLTTRANKDTLTTYYQNTEHMPHTGVLLVSVYTRFSMLCLSMDYDQTIFLRHNFCRPLSGVPTTNMNYSQPTGQYLQVQSIDS